MVLMTPAVKCRIWGYVKKVRIYRQAFTAFQGGLWHSRLNHNPDPDPKMNITLL